MIAAFRRRHRHRGVRQATAGPAEWYSPSWIVELARDTLGAIDCDPASDATAQAVVRAGVTFGVGRPDAEGGLSPAATWAGRVWMNPPYGRVLLPRFIAKLISEVAAGRVTQALVLTSLHGSSATAGQALMHASMASCVLAGRLTFWGPSHGQNSPSFGSVITGLGPGLDVERFQRVWRPHGEIMHHRSRATGT